jgi:alpha-1,6-mannosyltransferase
MYKIFTDTLDVLLNLSIPTLIIIHLLVAPYTKVEESFNIQAIHDIINYGLPTENITAYLSQNYDHFSFPGAVPRTFVGAIALSNLFPPNFVGSAYGQTVVRAVLGLFNAIALVIFKDGLESAYGKNTGRWYALLQMSQFHVIYYASRTLPNMFAFGLSMSSLLHKRSY